MSAGPRVAAICLTANRPEMMARAVRSFESQTYGRKRLIIFDTGEIVRYHGHFQHCVVGGPAMTIGALRNESNRLTDKDEILVHWDDDDLSHPNRITEQVALLQASGADAVGYSDMLFWHETPGEAWRYRAGKRNYALGTSLCYWRSTWETKPFPDLPVGEDTEWQRNLKVTAVSSIGSSPLMVASIHGGNTNMAGYKINLTGKCEEFKREPEFDDYCRGAMRL